jgi:hypothetical protein
MTIPPNVSVFPTRSREGFALGDAVAKIVSDLGFVLNGVPLDPQPLDYASACQNADVVILDATIEPKGQHNYHIAYPTPLDHVLVVSRTPLPLNFYGLRDSIVEQQSDGLFSMPRQMLIYGTPFYPERQSNADILRWLTLQLTELRAAGPRPQRQKRMIGSTFRGMKPSLDKLDNRRGASGSIFISFRSSDDDGVRCLKDLIERGQFPEVTQQPVRYFPPGILSTELMPEQRRWSILSMIDRFIGPATEFWVYESDDYYNSWWTIGELGTLVYRAKEGFRGKRPPRLRIYDPQTDKVRDAPKDYLPTMSKNEARRMARWYANSDAHGMSPESRLPMLFYQQIPVLNWLPYVNDHAWSQEFWQHQILDCACCRTIGKRRNQFDIDAFLWTRGPGFYRMSPQEVSQSLRAGSVVCPTCKTRYPLERGKVSHHLWITQIAASKFGTEIMRLFGIDPAQHDDPFLLPLPTYLVKS